MLTTTAGHPDVARVERVASRKRPYWLDATQQRLVASLSGEPPGPVYVCDDYEVPKLRWLLQRSGVPTDACVFANPACLLRSGEHWIERWQRFGACTPPGFAGAPPADRGDPIDAPRLFLTDADRRDVEAWLAREALDATPLVLLQPGDKRTLKRGRAGAFGDDKQWSLGNWAGLIRRLLAEPQGYAVLVCGASPEGAFVESVAATVRSPRVRAVARDLPLRRLLALCEHAEAMVSVDTGPAHAAAAMGCPVIVMYGAQPASLWKPRSPTGSAVVALGGLPERDAVARIPLDEVIDAWRNLPRRAPSAALARAPACAPS